MPRTLGLVLDGKKVNPSTIDLKEMEFNAYLDVNSSAIRVFTNESDFKSYIRDEVHLNFEEENRKMEQIRQHYTNITETQKKNLISEFTSKQKNIKNLLTTRGVSKNDEPELIRLHNAGEIGSKMIYDKQNYGGSWAYLSPVNIYFKLSYYGWNDRIKSLINLGLYARLYQHTFYRGYSLLVPPLAGYKSLGWFNNRASSVYFYGI